MIKKGIIKKNIQNKLLNYYTCDDIKIQSFSLNIMLFINFFIIPVYTHSN